MSNISPLSIKRRTALAGLAVGVATPGVVWAQSVRPVRLIVHSSTGTGTDATYRAMQPALARALNQPVVVENMPGAGGMISWQTVARSQPDSLTLAATSNNLVIQPHLMKAPPLDVINQLTPIAIIGETPVVIAVNPNKIKARNAQEFAAELKARRETLNFGSSGAGSTIHLATEMLLDEVGVKVSHVPYRGGGPLVTDLLGGQVDFATLAVSVALPHVATGALRVIGICTPQRVALAPELPTFVEQGINFTFNIWFGVFGPKGMALETVRRLNSGLATALAEPAVKENMAKQGTVIQVRSPEETQRLVVKDFAVYAAIVSKLDLKI